MDFSYGQLKSKKIASLIICVLLLNKKVGDTESTID